MNLARSKLEDMGFRDYILITLILGISILPEIPILTLPSGTEFTLRFEDIFLVAIITWIVYKPSLLEDLEVPEFYKYFLLYLSVLTIVTVINILVSDLPALRSSFYLLKKIEVMLIGCLILVFAREDQHLSTVSYSILLAAGLNSIWAYYQVITGDFGPLFYTSDLSKWRYGTSLIGQPAVVASGSYYIPSICLTAANALTRERRQIQAIYGAACVLLFGAMAGAVSRSSILGAIAGIATLTLLYGSLEIREYLKVGLPISIVVGALLYLLPLPVFRRFANASHGIAVRLQEWRPLLKEALPQGIVGWGAGSIQPLFGYVESHNHFIRVLIISGVIGLLLFLYFLLQVCRYAHLLKTSTSILERETLAMTSLGTTIGYSVIALFQDAFLNVMISEMFWIVTSAMGAALLIEQRDQNLSPQFGGDR